MEKTLINTTYFPLSFGRGHSHWTCCVYDF